MEWSVVIPAGRPGAARATLDSLLAQSFHPPGGWEALVVTPHPESEAPDSRIRYIGVPKLEIPGVMRNIGAAQALGRWFLFIDDDISLAPDFFGKLHRFIAQTENSVGPPVGAIGPRLPGPDDSFAGRLTDLSNFWSQQALTPGDRPWLYSATMAMPAELFRALGGFSPRLKIGEDVDLTQRVLHAGHRVCYDPALVAWHRHGRVTFARMVRYFWANGGAAPFLHQHCDHPRCFSIQTAVRHAWRDARSNYAINHESVAEISRMIFGVFMNYLLFQLSVEWHHQQGLLAGHRYATLPAATPSDRRTLQALADLQNGRGIRGSLRYLGAMWLDLFDPARR